MKELVLSNKQSCEARVSLVQAYNISINGKDDLIPVIKLLRSATKSIMAMQQGRKHLPDLYVKHMLTVLQTSSVIEFTHRIKQYDDTLEFQRYRTGDKSNSPKVLNELFNFALGVHAEMRSLGDWQDALLSKPKISFTTIYWRDRCWNCKKTGCNKYKCTQPIDETECSKNQIAWRKENQKPNDK